MKFNRYGTIYNYILLSYAVKINLPNFPEKSKISNLKIRHFWNPRKFVHLKNICFIVFLFNSNRSKTFFSITYNLFFMKSFQILWLTKIREKKNIHLHLI